MLIKGGNRGNAKGLARHVKAEENESVRVIRTEGIVARDIDGAMIELDALGANLRTTKTLYHASINPEPGKDREMSDADRDYVVGVYLKKLGLEKQPYILIQHEKYGEDGRLRRHWHIVSSVADLEHNRSLRFSHNYRKHEEASREIERYLGHEKVQGAHAERFGIDRPERTPTHAQHQQAKRGGARAKDAKALGAQLWTTADSGNAIKAGLEAHGWQLARGDKTRADGQAYFMAIDPQSQAHELRRMVPVKAAELYARMGDVDAAELPSVAEARTQQRARAAEMEQRRAADHYDELRPNLDEVKHRQPDRETEPRVFDAAAEQVTGPGIFDRDAADQAWMRAVEDAGIKNGERHTETPTEAREGRERLIPHAREPESSAHAEIREKGGDAGGEEIDGERVARGFFKSAAKFVEMAYGALFAWAMAPPKKTRQQVELEERAEAEEAPAHAAAAAERQKQAEFDEREHRAKSARQLHEHQLARILGVNPTSETTQGRDQYDRQREQERELRRDR